jgi:hypothetical protein
MHSLTIVALAVLSVAVLPNKTFTDLQAPTDSTRTLPTATKPHHEEHHMKDVTP